VPSVGFQITCSPSRATRISPLGPSIITLATSSRLPPTSAIRASGTSRARAEIHSAPRASLAEPAPGHQQPHGPGRRRLPLPAMRLPVPVRLQPRDRPRRQALDEPRPPLQVIAEVPRRDPQHRLIPAQLLIRAPAQPLFLRQ
jgi:hypothetical protein